MNKSKIPDFLWNRKIMDDSSQEVIDAINKWLTYFPCPMTFWRNQGEWYLKEIPPRNILNQLGYGNGPLIYRIAIKKLPPSKSFVEYDNDTHPQKFHVTTLDENSFCINHSLTFVCRRAFSIRGNTHVVFYFAVPDVSMAKACEAIGDYMSATIDYSLAPFRPKSSLDAIYASDQLLKSLDIIPTGKYIHERSRIRASGVIKEADALLMQTIDPPTVCYIRTLLPATFANMRAAEDRKRFSLDRFL